MLKTPDSTSHSECNLHEPAVRLFAGVMRAFLECSDEVRDAIIEMTKIINDKHADPEDKEMAVATIQEALFPTCHNGHLGADIFELEELGRHLSPESASVLDELDREEAAFADRVQSLMEARGLTQGDLAKAAGVGQPAISMMLSRNCRPQKRTISRIAEALGVSAEDLWPSA